MKYFDAVSFLSLFLCLSLCIPATNAWSQSRVKPGISVGMLTGGRASSSTFYFRGGVGGYFSLQLKKENQKIFPALNLGVERLSEETLLPIGLCYNVLFSENENSGFLTVGGGYALSFNENYENVSGYEYYGGAFFNPGWGYKWSLTSGSDLFVTVKYRHQFLRTEFNAPNVPEVTERFQYMMLQLTTGIIF